MTEQLTLVEVVVGFSVTCQVVSAVLNGSAGASAEMALSSSKPIYTLKSRFLVQCFSHNCSVKPAATRVCIFVLA